MEFVIFGVTVFTASRIKKRRARRAAAQGHSPIQKGAIALMALPPPVLAQVFQYLGPGIPRITQEISQLGPISPDSRRAIFLEFYEGARALSGGRKLDSPGRPDDLVRKPGPRLSGIGGQAPQRYVVFLK